MASAVSLILGGMLVSFLTGVLGSWNRTSNRDEAYTEARAALQLLGRELDGAVVTIGTKSALITNLTVPSGKSGEGIGFLCKVKMSAQPEHKNQSNLCAVAYYLSPISSEEGAPQALYRALVPSQDAFDLLTQGKTPFSGLLDWNTSNAEVVAQNVIAFDVKVLSSDFQEIDTTIQPQPTPAPVPAFLAMKIQVVGAQSAKRYFQTGASETLRDQIKQQDGREFQLRHRL